MANIKSAEKRARQIAKRREINKANRSAAKTAAVKALETIKTDAKGSLKAIADATSVLAKTAHSGSIPKRRAARKVSRLFQARNKALNA